MPSAKVLLLGANGNISLEVQRQLSGNDPFSYVTISSDELNQLRESTKGLSCKVLELLADNPELPLWIFNACGITNPQASLAELYSANVSLNLEIASLLRLGKVRLVTIGTVMERFPKMCNSNAYLHSKLKSQMELSQNKLNGHLHVRLHTLYGGRKMHSHMFLSQLFNAIANDSDFVMTEGTQVREYHHVEDDVALILRMMLSETFGTVEVSSGNPITLIDLATEIFKRLLPERNIITSLENNPREIFNFKYPRLQSFDGLPIHFRDSIEGVISYFQRFGTIIES